MGYRGVEPHHLCRTGAAWILSFMALAQTNSMTVDEAVSQYAAASGATGVQILRPFTVFSKSAYSVPVALPLGAAYLGALLEKAGYDVGLIDGFGEGIQNVTRSDCGRYNLQGLTIEQTLARILPGTSILGVSLMFSQEWIYHRELILRIRQAFPDLTIVAGGEHPTALQEYVLRDCPAIDYVVTGEGELIFLELVHAISNGLSTEDIQGIAYLRPDGSFAHNDLGRRIADFGNLPRPAWHMVDVEKYFIGMFSMGISYGRNMPILATRGCPYQCTFCSNPAMWTTRYLMRDPEDVIDEIEYLVREYGATSIDFYDLTAIVKREWILAFCKSMIRRGVDVVWQLPSGTRSEALDDETVHALYDSGCKYLVYAPESGSVRTLKAIKKNLKLERITKSIISAVKAGHTIKVNFVVGFPRETRRDILKTLASVLRMAFRGANDVNIAIFSPYPGSELFTELQQEGVLGEFNDEFFHDLNMQFDFTVPQSFCRHVPGWELMMYPILGMGSFYLISYLFYPARLLRLLRNVWKKDFQARSLFEQRVYDFLGRRRLRTNPG